MVRIARKVAIITGGASGMGLAVAQALSSRGGWDIHLIDLNTAAGEAAVASLPATFHCADVTSYASLSSVFKKVFLLNNRIDFVFANAGIVEKANFYETHEGVDPPPEFNPKCVDICLDSVITTSYLALHYFRLSPPPESNDKNLIMTASCGGIYPSNFSPTYSAAKHGVVGFMRSIAKLFFLKDQIRVNAICPGVVKTNLLTDKEWGNFPLFTPVESIVEAVLVLLDGKDEVVGNRIDEVGGGDNGKGGVLWGEALEISGSKRYYRDTPKYSDDAMRAVMKATDIEELEH